MTLSDSIFFRLLATWECFVGKIYHANTLPKDISSNRSKNLLISNGIIVKSEITNAWVIFSSTNCSLLTKVILKWVLTCQNTFDLKFQEKFTASMIKYDVLLAVELNTWTANFTFKFEYGVKIMCSFDSFGKICNPYSWSSYLCYGTILYTFHDSTHNVHTCYFQNLANNF